MGFFICLTGDTSAIDQNINSTKSFACLSDQITDFIFFGNINMKNLIFAF